LTKLKQELKRVKEENEILKKAAVFFEVSFFAYLPGNWDKIRIYSSPAQKIHSCNALCNSGDTIPLI